MMNEIISETFDRRMGDTALRSTDNVIFFIPRPILQYSSKVFEGMFDIGTGSTSDKPILMQADANSLKLILTFAHPGLPNPTVSNVSTMANLLRIARQYEMDGVLSSIKIIFESGASSGDLVKNEPLASLIVAQAFELREVAKKAIFLVAESDFNEECKATKGYDIPVPLVCIITTVRLATTIKYKTALISLYTIFSAEKGAQLDKTKFSQWLFSSQMKIDLIPTQKVFDAQVDEIRKEPWFTDEAFQRATKHIFVHPWNIMVDGMLDEVCKELGFVL